MAWEKIETWAICWTLASLATCGCHNLCGPQGLLEDPLFADRKPRLTKAVQQSVRDLPVREPSMPPGPPVQKQTAPGVLTHRENNLTPYDPGK